MYLNQTSPIAPEPTSQPVPLPKTIKMKIALIFLSVMVAITTQQYQRQRERLWWSPNYYPSHPSINNYQRVYQDLQDDIQPDYRRFRPTRPIVYSQDDEFDSNLVPSDYQDIEEDEYPDVQSRVKVYQQRRPLFSKRPVDQRFLLSYIRKFRTSTATFTVTSSITLTTVRSCIPAGSFKDDTAKTTTCRRKRELLDSNPEDNQFAIVPTETQKVMPTALPTLDLIRESRHVSADQDLTSSKGVSSSDIPESLSWMRSLLEPRLFNSFLTVLTTTVTTFSFLSETVTKPVGIIDNLAMVVCLPSGWAVC